MSIVLPAAMISMALFEFDPLNTKCQEKGSFGEYDGIAEAVEGRMRQGFTLIQALVLEFSDLFSDNKQTHTDNLDHVVAYLEGRHQ
ncbi:MAG: hypothetical protein ACTHYN_05625 [Marinobacter sp.]|uniref:hypothetical protein n=1 Tax=Marinobacter sp. TaxID=50741 RepID=UPI003F9669BC